jgi:hypothetical protein
MNVATRVWQHMHAAPEREMGAGNQATDKPVIQ